MLNKIVILNYYGSNRSSFPFMYPCNVVVKWEKNKKLFFLHGNDRTVALDTIVTIKMFSLNIFTVIITVKCKGDPVVFFSTGSRDPFVYLYNWVPKIAAGEKGTQLNPPRKCFDSSGRTK